MPNEGVTAWDDAVRGHVEVPNETIEDLVLVRSDGRPTYNFASPMEDVWDEITHVIRGDDHISNTPKQINIIRAVGGKRADVCARPEHLRRRREEAVEASRRSRRRRVPRRRLSPRGDGQLPRAARLGAGRRDDDHEPRRARRALQPRAGQPEPGAVRLREARLDERHVSPRAAGGRVRASADRLARRARLRLGRGARAQGRAARAGEDRAARRVPRLRRLPLP